MAIFGYWEQKHLKQEGYQEAKEELAFQAVHLSERALSQDRRDNELDLREKRLHDEAILDKELAEKRAELAQASLELASEQVRLDKSILQKKLDENKRAFDAEVKIEISKAIEELRVSLQYAVTDKNEHAAHSLAKDLIIASKDKEIERLTELLKVTMGKLTQIDLKGVTIQVDAGNSSHAKEGKNQKDS